MVPECYVWDGANVEGSALLGVKGVVVRVQEGVPLARALVDVSQPDEGGRVLKLKSDRSRKSATAS